MKVLIITYYWPPAGGSGVQRWLYFVKYLREFGIEPVVYTVNNPNYNINDESLKKHIPKDVEIIRQNIWEPHRLLGKRTKKTSSGFLQEKPGRFQRIIRYIRANFFIPDARMFWIRPSVNKILKYLHNNKIDWIITTGPPHSVHLIGKAIKEQTSVKWLADFRDPWTKIDYFHKLPLSKNSLQIHENMEFNIVSKADLVTVVSQTMCDNYSKINPNCYVITNGFDGEIFESTDLDKKFTLTHIGLLNADRNPIIFWKVIRSIIHENHEFKSRLNIKLIGKIADEVKKSIEDNSLQKYVEIIDYIPHEKVLSELRKSQILLLFVNKVPMAGGIITGKVFEYLQSDRPILALAPVKGDLAGIIRDTRSGKTVDFDDQPQLHKTLIDYFNLYKENELNSLSTNIEKYQRKNLTGQLARLLKNA